MRFGLQISHTTRGGLTLSQSRKRQKRVAGRACGFPITSCRPRAGRAWFGLGGLDAALGNRDDHRQLRLGILATGNTYRNPALLAKIGDHLDHISGGRVELGLGAAWYEQEHTAYGWDFPSLRERSDRLEEATQLIRLLLTKDPEEYVTTPASTTQLNDAPMSLERLRDRPIPILIGGHGEKRTLRTVARYGDTSNLDFWHPGGVDVYKHKQQVIDRHCEDFGRDPGEVAARSVCRPGCSTVMKNGRNHRASRGIAGAPSTPSRTIWAVISRRVRTRSCCAASGTVCQPWEQVDAEVLSVF